MPNTDYIVNVERLEPGLHEYNFVLDDSWFRQLEKTEILSGEVRVHAVLNITEEARQDNMLLDIAVKGTVQVICDRCLDPMDVEVEASENLAPEPENGCIDLAWTAYEILSVNLPLVHCHPAGGCNPDMAALLQNHLCSAAEEPEEQTI